MKIVTRKLNPDTNGPTNYATVSEQGLINLGYVWEFEVFNGEGQCVRVGVSKIKDEAKLLAYVDSGMNRLEWEAIHGKD